jgi:hypothetical protein
MVEKRQRIKFPAIMNNRFLIALLRILCHGKLNTTNLTMINNFFTKLINIDDFSKDLNIHTLITVIRVVVECKMSKVEDNSSIVGLIRSEVVEESAIEIVDDTIEPIIMNVSKISEKEIGFITDKISMYSRYGYILAYKNPIIDKIIQIESGNTQDITESISSFMKTIKILNNRLHKTAAIDGNSLTESVSLNDPNFMDKYFTKLYALSKKKTRCLKTGIKAFNEMCGDGGGLYTGSMYCINAPTNSFKTAFLLHLAKWIRAYNHDVYAERFKETGKIPTILFVSLENTWDENLDRMFSMVTGRDMQKTSTIEEAKKMWKDDPSATSIIDIVMEYGKANRFSPADLEQRIDELESTENREVICCIIDYMKNMRDDLGDRDPRMKLINVSKDLYDLTTTRPEMCMITAHHTNRDADRMISEMGKNGAIDKAKSLSREQLTEANAAEEALDFSFYICPEQSPYDKEWYLGIKLGKTRKKRSMLEYIAHPLRNRFYLIDDINLPRSLSLRSISETMDANVSNMVGNPRGNTVNRIEPNGRQSARIQQENATPENEESGFIELGL